MSAVQILRKTVLYLEGGREGMRGTNKKVCLLLLLQLSSLSLVSLVFLIPPPTFILTELWLVLGQDSCHRLKVLFLSPLQTYLVVRGM